MLPNRLLEKSYRLFHEAVVGREATDDMIATVEAAHREADVSYLMDEIPAAVEQSLEGIRRATTIIGAMKSFCHPGSRKKVATDLAEAIETTITIS